ncbi:protein Gawky isoform X7 [Copidosoma floridanum]|uniref:protein Gawky isoform X7 n=1 Tax=Copidosoma floridanum TaxID=29053 RepID=UPI000C6FB1CF|nr:protein Gawky isoform X7 [Copidosoma floridanum]
MFPHNSSSHKISTETNAFVQNSKGDVVVLEGSSLSGVGEGYGSEDAGYCDIEFINNNSSSSSTMTAPNSHPEATAANDFSTVPSCHSGELGLARRSSLSPAAAIAGSTSPMQVASAITASSSSNNNNNDNNNKEYNNDKSVVAVAASAGLSTAIITTTNSNNKKINLNMKKKNNNNNNAEHNHHYHHNHHKCRKVRKSSSSKTWRRWPGGLLRLNKRRRPASSQAAANSKSTSKPLSDNKDSFRSLSPRVLSIRRSSSRLFSGGSGSGGGGDARISYGRKDKITKMMKNNKIRHPTVGPTPSLVRIPKSDGQRAFNLKAKISHVSYFKPNNSKSVISLGSGSSGSFKRRANNATNTTIINNNTISSSSKRLARTASSSITLIVSKRREPQAPGAAPSEISSLLSQATNNGRPTTAINELKRRLISALCVPLTISTPDGSGPSARLIDGISCTEATICTVGALSFLDNNKSNEPLNISFKSDAMLLPPMDNEQQQQQRQSNLILKSLTLSKSTPSVKSSDKSDTDVVTITTTVTTTITSNEAADDSGASDGNVNVTIGQRGDDNNNDNNIPTPTTCDDVKPTMTLTSQYYPIIVTQQTSQTNDVPAACEPRLSNNNTFTFNDNDKDQVSTLLTGQDQIKKIVNDNNQQTRASLVEDCKDLIAEYRVTRDKRYLTKLREVLDTLLTINSSSNNNNQSCAKAVQQYNVDFVLDYKLRWGIPTIVGLAGGGESSLNNSATANWASTQPTTPNNNNQNQSGWGNSGSAPGTAGNQVGGQAVPPNNWQSVTGPRPIGNQINNQQSPNQNQGPPGPPNNQGIGSNAPPGPPTSQPSNQNQPNQGNGGNAGAGGQWNQGGPKPVNNVNNPNNPPNNNNGSNVPSQQQPQQQQQQQSPQQQQQPQQVQVQNQQPQPQPTTGNNNQQIVGNPGTGNSVSTPSSNTTVKQYETTLHNMREAIFSTDGWGSQNHVNQDTSWDVPTSPEPAITKDGVPMWKPPVNNGTELWEANLRNGGQPPPQQAKAPWGHTPSTNIGGTWGEDDDAADTSNMWTGAPAPSQPNAGQWPGNSGNQTGMWNANLPPPGVPGGAGGNNTGSSWGDPRVDPRDPRELRSVDPREMRGGDPRDHRMSLDPREQHIRVNDPMARDPRMSGEMRGDPRGGISGRLNGASADAMWNLPPAGDNFLSGPPHHQMPGHHNTNGPPPKMIAPTSMNQWSAPPKDMIPSKSSGWEEPSPPAQRRNVPNYDDGTNIWQQGNQRTMPSKVSHWKEAPSQNLGRGESHFLRTGMQCPPGMLQNQMPPGQPGMKPDPLDGGGSGSGSSGPMWGGHPGSVGPIGGGHNGSWTDGPPDSGWADSKLHNRRRQVIGGISDPRTGKPLWDEHQKPHSMGPSGGNWIDSDMDPTSSWGHSAKLNLSKEHIYNSREFRNLCDMGFKKEDVEMALRNREMNREEAQELLSQLRPVDQWRRHDGGHSSYDPGNQAAGSQSFPRFNHVSQQMSFPQASRNPTNQPSTQQLRMLVQQIQLAVQEGYLNHQILNQPLAPQTLLLLNQLLQQIKTLQQLHQQHTMQNSLKGNSQNVLQISVNITKTKQQIANLQNQIAIQQATYMKQQQQQQQQQHPSTPSQSDYYKTSSVHDPMSALSNSFSDLAMNKEAPVSQPQSRLNQWKLPSLDKDVDSVVNEFSRAPGSASSKPPTTPGGLSQSHSSPNMNPLLGPSDNTWSSRLGDSGWPDAGNSDSTDGKDWQTAQSAAGAAFTDLVPEFEPGKPWKGTQMKSIEDDPSITPGSVVRSPLSLAAIKDSDTLFSTGNKSPPPQAINVDSTIPSLSNSTWSFNPPAATTPSVFSSSKNTWGESAPPPTPVTSELWGAPMGKSRGPPPGLSSKGTNPVSNTSNGWALGGRGSSANTWTGGLGQSNAPGGGVWSPPSTWLLLRNLTPQIDGSTLKTLCMQHGPVSDFRLYLHHGVALAKYSSRAEAIKAQGALNNCVLGNTTIFAESPLEGEIDTLLKQLLPSRDAGAGPAGTGAQQPNSGAGWGLRPAANKAGPPTDTWGASTSQLWGAPPSSNSLWGSSGLDSSDQQRATPSSLNSYLPGDLLGGESM